MSDKAPADDKYEETGGGSVGDGFLSIGVPFPLMGITVSRTDITVRVLWKRYRLPREAITRLWRYRTGWFGDGWPTVAIDHSLKGVPTFVFFSWNYAVLKAKLEQFGYVVHEKTY